MEEKHAPVILIEMLKKEEPIYLSSLQKLVKNYYALHNTIMKLSNEGYIALMEKHHKGKTAKLISLTEMGRAVAKALRFAKILSYYEGNFFKTQNEYIDGYVKAKISEIEELINNVDVDGVRLAVYELIFLLATSPEYEISEEILKQLNPVYKKLKKAYGKSWDALFYLERVIDNLVKYPYEEDPHDAAVLLGELNYSAKMAYEEYNKLLSLLQIQRKLFQFHGVFPHVAVL